MLVKIISGTYGHNVGGRIEAKDRTSKSFELDDAEAERLMKLKVAEKVENKENNDGIKEGLLLKEDTNGYKLDAEQLEMMTNKDLKKLAEEMGIDTSKMKKKDDYISAICDVEIEAGDELPTLGAEDPVV